MSQENQESPSVTESCDKNNASSSNVPVQFTPLTSEFSLHLDPSAALPKRQKDQSEIESKLQWHLDRKNELDNNAAPISPLFDNKQPIKIEFKSLSQQADLSTLAPLGSSPSNELLETNVTGKKILPESTADLKIHQKNNFFYSSSSNSEKPSDKINGKVFIKFHDFTESNLYKKLLPNIDDVEKSTSLQVEQQSKHSTNEPNENPSGFKNQIERLYEESAKQAIKIVLEEFPRKIKHMEDLKKQFDWDQVSTFEADTDWFQSFVFSLGKVPDDKKTSEKLTKTVKCIQRNISKPFIFDSYLEHRKSSTDYLIGSNSVISNMSEQLKPFLDEVHKLALKIWFGVKVLEPKLQDGNNFGVEVQMKALYTVESIMTTSESYYVTLNSYIAQRYAALHTMIHYPHIEDYRIRLTELDRHIFYLVCCAANHLYNSYTELHDVVVKNLEKVLRPRDTP